MENDKKYADEYFDEAQILDKLLDVLDDALNNI